MRQPVDPRAANGRGLIGDVFDDTVKSMGEITGAAKLALAMQPAGYRRFALARMLADAVWMGSEAFGVVSRARTERQKFQRGFAQALLCPFQEVPRFIEAEDPAEQQNKNILPRETLLDLLEAC